MVVTASRIFVANPKHAGLVAVECKRFTVLLQIAARGVKIGERGLRFYEVERYQATGHVINVDQQRSGRSAFLKPAAIAAVDLYQFTNAAATIPRLLDPRRTHLSGDPESGSHHQLTHSLFSQHNVMEFGQLLAGELRTKVGVVIADEGQSKFSKTRHKLAITTQSTAAVRQCQRPGWLDRINASDLIRSMSRKGCSLDNAACEGFFGRVKNEMYYGSIWGSQHNSPGKHLHLPVRH